MATNLPEVTMTIQDGGLGLVPPSVAGASVKMGVCSAGVVGQLYSFGDMSTLTSTLGAGPLAEAVAETLSVAGGPVYAIPLNPTTAGAATGVTHTGPGAGVVTVTLAPAVSVAIKIGTGGVNGTATFSVSVNGGAYGTPVATTGGTFAYAVPGTLTTVTLAAAQTWVSGEIYTIATDGSVTLTGSGPAASNVTHADSPLDAYSVVATITTGGGVGTAVFTYSVDGGASTSANIATAAKYAIPGTGVVLNFSATFTAADAYTFTTTTAAANNTDVTNGLTTLLGQAIEWGFVHLVGAATTSSGAAATAAVVDTQMTTAETAFRYVWALTECPTTESDATVAAAFASFSSRRVAVAAGDIRHISVLTGRILRRNCAWVVASRAAATLPAEDLGYRGSNLGSIPHIQSVSNGVSGLYRDEGKTPLLDQNRFMTMTTMIGRQGYFITVGRTMAPAGSDFTYLVGRRVMDAACRIVRQAEIPYVNGSVRVTGQGFIDDGDARAFEMKVTQQIKAGLAGQISDAVVVVNRTANILSTGIEPVAISVTPLGYTRQIQTTIGFRNPALA